MIFNKTELFREEITFSAETPLGAEEVIELLTLPTGSMITRLSIEPIEPTSEKRSMAIVLFMGDDKEIVLMVPDTNINISYKSDLWNHRLKEVKNGYKVGLLNNSGADVTINDGSFFINIECCSNELV